MRRLFLWFLPAGIAAATAGVFAAGFWAGVTERLGVPASEAVLPSPTPAPPAPSGSFLVVALGDSMTRGAGDAAGGYPERVGRALRKEGRTVTVENLAVDGFRTADLLRKLSEPGVRDRVAAADLILLSISGNDLMRALPGGPAPEGGGALPAVLARVEADVERALAEVRSVNPKAPVRLLGLYNPFSGTTADRRMARQALLISNGALDRAALGVEGALVVPVADLFEERPDRLAADRFHPGPSGYDEIAARVVSTLPPAAPGTGSGRQSGP
ncbi:MAG TPA: GDSL-type esterase/lipase family protein [Thermoanaerobaculia bacterium]|nr:GDSL-type esterase/lipase family protein [Thermoanaerobaculia bacterium]